MARKPKKENYGSMTNLATEKIKELILRGKLSPGQKLLYSDLERTLNMSKTPIISALNRLESEGYVYLKKNAGYYITEVNLDEIVQVFQAREILELANLNNVMKNYTASDFQKLEKIHKEYTNYTPNFFDRKKALLNAKFHIQIARMGKNGFLVKYIEHIYEWIDLRIRFSALPVSRIQEGTIEHGKILEAIRVRDLTKTKQLLKNQFRKVSKILVNNLRKDLIAF
jgi:DNA-binding GntR family transcriptional regulator